MDHVANVCHGKMEQEEKKTNYLHQQEDPDLGLFIIETINCVHTDAICVNSQMNGTTV